MDSVPPDEQREDEELEVALDPQQRSIEPGDPDLEHVVFVLLGAVGTVLVFLQGLGFL